MPDEALILPIGHDLGARSTRWQQVRVGAELMELSSTEYVVWVLAHSLDEEDRLTRHGLVRQATRFGLESAVTVSTVERFLSDGLLAELVPGADRAISFAQGHQLRPLMLGLGPDPHHDGMLLVGLLGQPLAQLSAPLYDLWTWAHLSPDLWHACEDAAAVAARRGVTNAAELDPALVLSGALEALHGLLRVRAAYLDRRAAA